VWLRLQARYDLEVAEMQLAERIERKVKELPRQAVDVLEL
jgi:plasmid maintenance system antidote protein VapI